LGIFVPQLAFALSFIFLATTLLSLKMLNRKKKEKIYKGIALLGIIISALHLIPLILTPTTMLTAELSFSEAFGANWRSNINLNMEMRYFKTVQFSSPGLFLSIQPKDCNYKADVLYFNGSESSNQKDENIMLYFDVFWPKVDAADLPGKTPGGGFSIIIKIHGGGWSAGDKGAMNSLQVNKYFAAQGYVVYDIQYGLSNQKPMNRIIPTPVNVLGDFNITDMIRHIGNFTRYMAKASNEYSAIALNGDLDYVFVSGGSAGGHLTCATALGIASNNYTQYFSNDLTIKGMIPFYPANGHSGLPGLKELENPERYLVNSSSPPTLIFQGTHDFSCAPVSIDIKNYYTNAGNGECCIIWFPLAGHANDLYFSGHYNQVFLYYMERFLYLCVNGYIT